MAGRLLRRCIRHRPVPSSCDGNMPRPGGRIESDGISVLQLETGVESTADHCNANERHP